MAISKYFLFICVLPFFFVSVPAFECVSAAQFDENGKELSSEQKSGESEELSEALEPMARDLEGLKNDFQKGYKAFSKKDYQLSARIFHGYLNQLTADDEDYDWAEFFFGISLKKLGYSHAAADVLAHLVTRKPNPKIVAYCLEVFEETMRSLNFDRELFINDVLGDQDYGFVEEGLANFVHYYQGIYDWEHGFYEWGNEHFNKITPLSYYYYKYLYIQALFSIDQDRIDDAISLLNQIIERPEADTELQDEVRMTLARLLYEKGDFEHADFIYGQIRRSVTERPEILLERAWAHYQTGHPEKAMGLLYSFEAPSFQHSFRPEYFILKSFIYKDVCHYQTALLVVNEFKKRYGEALRIIYERNPAEDNTALMLVLLNKEKVNRVFGFLNLLESEREACKVLDDSSLRKYVEKIYDLQIEESKIVLRQLIEEEYEKNANELLGYEEEADLMEYEIGLDMYKRVYQNHYREDASEKEKAVNKGIAKYNFQGEFWNDELASYQVVLPNRCENMEEWDIFFK